MSTVVARPVGQADELRSAVRIEAAPDGVAVGREQTLHRSATPRGTSTKASLLYFPDGRRFAVEDTLALDTVLAEARIKQHRRRRGLLGRFGWQCAVIVLLMVAAVATLAHRWSVPLLHQGLVSGVSARMSRVASAYALEELDAKWLRPSELDEARQNALRARFAGMNIPGGEGVAWRVLFRSGVHTGPVSFSLPDGGIVLSDELVHMARSDDEVVAILAHEFAHLARQDAWLALAASSPFRVLSAWVGQDTTARELASGLLSTRLDSVASGEADALAAGILRANGIAPAVLADMRVRQRAQLAANLPPLLGVR